MVTRSLAFLLVAVRFVVRFVVRFLPCPRQGDLPDRDVQW
jgi:hypothetical protein